MAKNTQKDESLYNDKGNIVGTVHQEPYDTGVTVYDKKGQKVVTFRKDMFGDGESIYDPKGNKIGTARQKSIGEGTVIHDTKGKKIAEIQKDRQGNNVITESVQNGKTYREIADEMDARADEYIKNRRGNIPPGQNTFREWYSDESISKYYPEETYKLSQAEGYFRFVGSFLLKKYKGRITTDYSTIEREDNHYYGPFNLLRKKNKNRVQVPEAGYWCLNRKKDSYTGGNEDIREKNYITETGITPEGKIITVEYEEQYYTDQGARYYHETYKKFSSHITVENISNDPDRYIAMADHYLNSLNAGMSFSKYLSRENDYKTDDREVADYSSYIKNEAEKIMIPAKIIDGKFNNWQWLAFIPFSFCVLWSMAFSDLLLILYVVLIALWLLIYPFSRFRFEKINPQADNYMYEIIILISSVILLVCQIFILTKTGQFHDMIERVNHWDVLMLFSKVCHAICILGSVRYKQKTLKAKPAASAEKHRERKPGITVLVIAAAVLTASLAGFIVWKKVIVPERKYKAAVQMIKDGYRKTAFDELLALNGYKDSYDLARDLYNEYKVQGLYNYKSVNVKDSLYFGTYEQDNNLSNGEEFIEWTVLAKEDEKVLLVSKYGLITHHYNEESADVTWETCSLRQWLNKEFMETAFSPEDRNAICRTTVEAEKNPLSGTKGGKKTTDKVFLLGFNEIVKYYENNDTQYLRGINKARQCKATSYALANGAYDYDGGYTAYWLRTPEYGSEYGSIINQDSSISGGGGTGGVMVISDSICVRPVIWITLGNQ